MIVIDRSALIHHPANKMYALVEDIESYPRFLPWCARAEVPVREESRTVATLHIDFRGIRQQFTTDNDNRPGQSIEMKLVSGPFKELRGSWRFSPLAEDACKIEFRLEYEIASRLLERVIGPVFEHIANTLVDAFARRAEEVYGPA